MTGDLWAAFGLGLVGSGHCLLMCGPLALALPEGGRHGPRLHLSRISYNLGRTATYGLLGLLFGAIGQSLAIAGLQRVLSVGLGLALLGLAVTRGSRGNQPPLIMGRLFATVQSRLAILLFRGQNETHPTTSVAGRDEDSGSSAQSGTTRVSPFGVGLLNGLLPCGLVWAALAAATALGSAAQGGLFMVLFGLGTLPAMLAAATLGHLLASNVRIGLAKAAPIALVALALLLVVRGLLVHAPHAMG